MNLKKLTTLFAAVTISCFSFSTAFADFAYGDRGEEIVEIVTAANSVVSFFKFITNTLSD